MVSVIVAWPSRAWITPILSAIEEWAFPTYARDNKPSVDFSIPGSILLRKTAIEKSTLGLLSRA